MGNGVSSPGDPLFYLHHTWLDKAFWDWQAKDKAARVKRVGGTNIGPDFAPGFPPRPASIPWVFSFLLLPFIAHTDADISQETDRGSWWPRYHDYAGPRHEHVWQQSEQDYR